MEIAYSARFRKQYTKANQKIKNTFNKRLKLFKQNPLHPFLKNHLLTGDYKGYRSINITGDWRAIYTEENMGDTIVFELLGTHSQLYG